MLPECDSEVQVLEFAVRPANPQGLGDRVAEHEVTIHLWFNKQMDPISVGLCFESFGILSSHVASAEC